METGKDSARQPGSGGRWQHPRAVIWTDMVVAALFCAAGAYHFTQPDQAWRSGAIEVTCAMALLVAAYLLGRWMAVLVHVDVALGITSLGIRHLVLGGGWKSGTMELVMAVVLLGVAAVLCRRRPERL